MKLFDWFTVFAQIVNFLILVALLKHFLYGRILRAIDSREDSIKARLAEAEQNLHQAELEKQDFQKRLHELEDARDAMLSQSQQDADRKRLDLMKKAREEISALEERWRADLERERTALFQDIRGRAAGEILFVVRRALHDLACCDLDQCAARVFLNKLASMEVGAWKELAGQAIVIRSASELPQEIQQKIEEILTQQAVVPVVLRFEKASSLGWGLELRANGRKIAWSAEGYVDALEERLRDALEKKTGEVAQTVVV
jgi:F-type H+-transporting ATPase subunit b